jgi:hypothetical protein
VDDQHGHLTDVGGGRAPDAPEAANGHRGHLIDKGGGKKPLAELEYAALAEVAEVALRHLRILSGSESVWLDFLETSAKPGVRQARRRVAGQRGIAARQGRLPTL